MAKETKAKTTEVVEITPDNVAEEVRKGNLIDKANVDAALAEIEKETNDKKKAEAKEAILSAQYNKMRSLFELRARRREEKMTKEALVARESLLNDLLGGKITPAEYTTKKGELSKEMEKKRVESDKQLNSELNELRESYAGAFRWYW